ncbi:MAG: RES domain-containing protein [Bacteroidetes bacterium]|jgi:RES domain-containing protein|nr:RES domain-containing protein [Bacteroidota bacterium]
MPHTVWRITHARYRETAFSGAGARQYGGRFNSRGVPAVYTSESLALALVETLVGLTDVADLQHYLFFRADLPEHQLTSVSPDDLPDAWDAHPPPQRTQALGDRWVTQRHSLVLRVPSVVVPYSYNYVLNPKHPAFPNVTIHETERLPVDPRIIK